MRAIGIVLAGGNKKNLDTLVKKRAVAAMPIAGSYRSVDFALSNMSHSHIQKVAVCTQYNARSLNHHLNSSKWWDFGRKQGGLYILTPTITSENEFWYRGTADALYQNLDFLTESHEPYVIITSADCVYKMDYNKMLAYHIDTKADITVAYTELSTEVDDISRFGVVSLDENQQIISFEEKPKQSDSQLISAGVYIVRRRLLVELLKKSNAEGKYDFVRDILIRYCGIKKLMGYRLDGYWRNIATVRSYFDTNMDFIKPEIRDYFFGAYYPVYSKVVDNPPAKYNPGASIRDAIVASGCIVNGSVEHAVLFRKAYIGNNSIVKNSIILNDAYIGDNVVIENCIVESHSTIKAGTVYKGERDNIKIVDEKNERYNI